MSSLWVSAVRMKWPPANCSDGIVSAYRSPPLPVAELRAVDLHEHGVDGPVAGALRGGARRLHVAHDDHRERDDEPEEDQAPIHATDCTPAVLRRT